MSEPRWIYVGCCQGCGEEVEAVLGNYAEEIGEMAMSGLIVIRREGTVTGARCFCPKSASADNSTSPP